MMRLRIRLVAECHFSQPYGVDRDVVRLRSELIYDPTDPYALTVEFVTTAGPRPWVVARDVLCAGLSRHAGLGDVQVWPDAAITPDRRVWIKVVSPSGRAVFAFPHLEVAAAVHASYELVPSGTESACINWDRELAVLRGDR